jgi:hypothetical protein
VWMRRCWNQIYVHVLQRSTLSLRPCVKRVRVTDPEIVNRRVNRATNGTTQTVLTTSERSDAGSSSAHSHP